MAAGDVTLSRKDYEKMATLWGALKTISKYQTPEQLRRGSRKQYGLEYEEALEYAYENIMWVAKRVLASVKLPKPPAA